jgi:ElaA protein
MNVIRWHWYAWNEWSNDTLYAAMRLRSAVFVVEQNCVFLDLDGIDPHCLHLCGFAGEEELVAYARLVPPELKYPGVAIGRVVTAPALRGSGLGHELMRQAMAGCAERYPDSEVFIGAQQHLERYYGRHGFVQYGEPYLEDGIPHIDMRSGPQG